MGVTARGLHYPEPTDRVSLGAAAIQTLAEDVNALANDIDSNLKCSAPADGSVTGGSGSTPPDPDTTPYRIRLGHVTGTTNATGDLWVDFVEDFPTGIILMLANVGNGDNFADLTVSTWGGNKTGRNARVYIASTGAPFVGSVTLDYIAVGY